MKDWEEKFKAHPELREGEIFLTNADEEDFNKCGYITKRKGEKAFDMKGNLMEIANYFPIFVNKEEYKEYKNLHRKWDEKYKKPCKKRETSEEFQRKWHKAFKEIHVKWKKIKEVK